MRLKRKKLIRKLFSQGKAKRFAPVRLVYLPCTTIATHQVLFAVPSKRIKRAVDRNKLKRRMREAFRLHQKHLVDRPDAQFLIGYVYIGPPEPCNFQKIQAQIVASIHFLNNTHVPIQNTPPTA